MTNNKVNKTFFVNYRHKLLFLVGFLKQVIILSNFQNIFVFFTRKNLFIKTTSSNWKKGQKNLLTNSQIWKKANIKCHFGLNRYLWYGKYAKYISMNVLNMLN